MLSSVNDISNMIVMKNFFLSYEKDLVYFTRVPDMSDTSPTRTTRVQQEGNTNDTSETRAS